MNQHSRVARFVFREPFALAALLTFGALYIWHRLVVIEWAPLPFSMGPVAIETIAEFWCISGLPAMWLAEHYRRGPVALLLASTVPPIVLHLALFNFGSVLVTVGEHPRNLQVVQFAVGATMATGAVAVSALLLLRRAASLLAEE